MIAGGNLTYSDWVGWRIQPFPVILGVLTLSCLDALPTFRKQLQPMGKGLIPIVV